MTRRRCPTCHGRGTYTRHGEQRTCSCIAGLEINLGDIPALVADLETTLARQGATGGRVGARSSEKLLPFDGRAGAALTALWRMLAGWVVELMPSQPTVGPSCRSCEHATCVATRRDRTPGAGPIALSGWLLGQYPRLLAYPAIDELTADVDRHVTDARRIIDRHADRVYLGPCATKGCVTVDRKTHRERSTDLYADPDAKTTTCPACGRVYNVADQRAELLAVAEDRLATATDCSAALTSLGEPVTPDRIWKWAERGRLVAHGVDVQKRPTYRIGDVIDLLQADRERREALRAARERQEEAEAEREQRREASKAG